MTATGAVAGISSGLAVEQRSYHDLAHWAALVAVFGSDRLDCSRPAIEDQGK